MNAAASIAASLTVGELAAPRKSRRDEAERLASRKMSAAASIAASLAVGELAAPLNSRRDEAAAAAAHEAETQTAAVAAAATAAARILLNTFAVAEHGDFEDQFRWVRRCFIQVADDPSK